MRTSKHWKKEVCKNLSNLELHYFIRICKQKGETNGKGSSFKNEITIHIIEIHWRFGHIFMLFKDPLYYIQ